MPAQELEVVRLLLHDLAECPCGKAPLATTGQALGTLDVVSRGFQLRQRLDFLAIAFVVAANSILQQGCPVPDPCGRIDTSRNDPVTVRAEGKPAHAAGM